MLQLFKSEFLRYRKWSFLAMGVILAAFAFIARLKPFLEPTADQLAFSFLIMVGGSLLFGLVQMYLHKRPNHWTYLVHRPLETRKIYLAMVGAGAASIATAVVIPWLVMTAGIDLFTNDTVDFRHYVFIAFFLMCCLVAYLIGTLAILNASKGVLLLGVYIFMFIEPDPISNFWQFFPGLSMIALLLYLNFISFKPDLGQHTRSPLGIVLLGLPMSGILVYALIISTTVFYHIPLFIIGAHPDNNPVDGTFGYLWNHDENKRPAYILETSDHPKAEYYAKQAELADVDWYGVDAFTFGRRGQIPMKDGQYALRDSTSNSTWQFSHDLMLLEGRHNVTKAPVGFVGKKGFVDTLDAVTEADRFEGIPFLAGEEFLQTQQALYQINFEERLLDVKFQPADGSLILGPPQIHENFVVMVTENEALIFDRREFLDEYIQAVPEHVVPHPVDRKNIYYVSTYRVVDGYLLMYLGRHYNGFHRSGAEIIHAKLGGGVESIGAREFDINKHPDWIMHWEDAISPTLQILKNVVYHAIEPVEESNKSWSVLMAQQYPAHIYWMAVIFMVISTIGANYWCRRHGADKAATITWTVMGAVISLPALLACVLMNPFRREV